MLSWKIIDRLEQLNEISQISHEYPCLIFKHSTRCSISSIAKMRLESDWDEKLNHLQVYYLDLISYRDISQQIANQFSVHHESPQVLLIQNGECTYDASHLDITVNELLEVLEVSVNK